MSNRELMKKAAVENRAKIKKIKVEDENESQKEESKKK